MNLMQWRSRPTSPFDIFGLQQEINRMFQELGGNGSRESGENQLTPALDVKEDEKSLTITVDLPGVDQKDVEIALHDNVLCIRGEKRSERHEKKDSYRLVERMFGSFERRVQLPAEVDSEQAEATMENGVLMLRLPKRNEGARGRTIPIRGASSGQGQSSMSEPVIATDDPSRYSGSTTGQSQTGQSQTRQSMSEEESQFGDQSLNQSMVGNQTNPNNPPTQRSASSSKK
jgi:HSP20 family protein